MKTVTGRDPEALARMRIGDESIRLDWGCLLGLGGVMGWGVWGVVVGGDVSRTSEESWGTETDLARGASRMGQGDRV
jgi:hypothetical protein